MCTKITSAISDRLAEVQNTIGNIKDSLSVIEGNLCDIADYYYTIEYKDIKGVK